MTEAVMHVSSWDELDRDEARFRRVLGGVALPIIALSIVITLWEVTGLQEGGGDELPARYAQLLLERAQQQAEQEQAKPEPEPVVEEPEPEVEEEPEPEPEQKAEPEPKPEQKPQPKPDRAAQEAAARRKVQREFSSAFDALKDLRQAPIAGLSTSRPLQQSSAPTQSTAETSSSLITTNLAGGSGGVSTQRRTLDTPRTGLAGRQTTEVTSTITATGGVGPKTDKTGFGGDKRLQGRTLEEIQIVMDRHKGRLYSLYNRALRADPTLQGKVVLEITIAPSGAVTRCDIVSSELRDEELERKISNAVKLINFGAKNVAEMTIKYPIHFIPS